MMQQKSVALGKKGGAAAARVRHKGHAEIGDACIAFSKKCLSLANFLIGCVVLIWIGIGINASIQTIN